jgi:hypothetical protein
MTNLGQIRCFCKLTLNDNFFNDVWFITMSSSIKTSVGQFLTFSMKTLKDFQSDFQNENRMFLHEVITFFKTYSLIFVQVKIDCLKTSKGNGWTFKVIRFEGIKT